MSHEPVDTKLESLEVRAKQLVSETKVRLHSSRQAVEDASDAIAPAGEAAERAAATAAALRDATIQVRVDVERLKQALADIRDERVRALEFSSLNSQASDLRRRWAVPVNQPMVLISQVERAGGTLLLRLFDGHPACFVHPHEFKSGEYKFHWPRFEIRPGDAADTSALFERLREHSLTKFLSQGGYYKWPRDTNPELLPFVFDPELQRTIFDDVLARQPPASRRDVLNAFLTSLFNAWLDYQNLYAGPKKVVPCFLPRMLMDDPEADRFFDDYPDGHLLSVVRHPAAWLASAVRFRGAAIDLRDWTASVKASVQAQSRRPDRVTLIVFEDVVLKTESVMRLICNRVGIDFSPILLAPTFNGIPVLSDSSFAPTHGIDPGVTTRYQSALSAEQLAEAEEACMPTYREITGEFSVV